MELVFIYNAKSDKINKALDFAHKIVSPKTYACDLCNLTHGKFGEYERWKLFRKTHPYEMAFYYKDDYPKAFEPSSYPCVLLITKEKWKVLLSKEDFKGIKDTGELIDLLKRELYRVK